MPVYPEFRRRLLERGHRFKQEVGTKGGHNVDHQTRVGVGVRDALVRQECKSPLAPRRRH
jgi:hypothetical protein